MRGLKMLYIFVLLLCTSSLGQKLDIPIESKAEKYKDNVPDNNDGKNKENEEIPVINIKEKNNGDKGSQHPEIKIDNKETSHNKNAPEKNNKTTSNSSVTIATKINPKIQNNPDTDIESGAVLRGVYVFVGLTLIFIMYIAFTTYRKKGNKQNVLIRKYGIRTRRTDVEMEPLPLDEDEEDETVFDLGNIQNR